MNSTEDMVRHRGQGASRFIVMFVCECMRYNASQLIMFVCSACDMVMVRHRRNCVCVVVHAVWSDVDVSRV